MLSLLLLVVLGVAVVKGATERFDYCAFYPFHTLCLYRERDPLQDCLGHEFNDGKDHYLPEGRLTKEQKSEIMRAHNVLREKVAKGHLYREANPALYLPMASNMYELVWDDELEEAAQAHADRCQNVLFDVNRDVERFLVGQNIYHSCYTNRTWGDFKAAEVIDVWAETRYSMTKERFYGYSPRLGGKHMRLYTFAQMIWGPMDFIGCARAVFKGMKMVPEIKEQVEVYISQVVCNYGPSGMEMRQPIYDVGENLAGCCKHKSLHYPAMCYPCERPSRPINV
ncbi:venom allergen 5 [Nilaparvata lugens]|uniref:venom allergen 5 n=1 Tax=Nilaparvata lugens TaxID=108931 RepID=UPI00193E0AB9|nr:venom allergen 5 [Nilaparvata lugens]